MTLIRKIFGAPPRVLLMRFLGRLHGSIPVALVTCAVFEAMHLNPIVPYFRSLLFCIPLAVSYYAIGRLRTMWQYLLFSVLLTAAAWPLLGHPGGCVLTALVCIFRARFRMAEEKGISYLDRPFFSFLAFFGVTFLVSAFADLHVFQRMSLISAVVYFIMCVLYYGMNRVENYLLLNRDMHNLPSRRIRRTAGAAVLAAVVLSAVLLLPPAIMNQGNLHLELPDRAHEVGYTQEADQIFQDQAATPMGNPFSDEEWGEAWQIPPAVSYVLFAAIGVGIAFVVFSSVYQMFKNFRITYTDSRDVVQFLRPEEKDEDDAQRSGGSKRPRLWDRSPNAMVRKRYRKTILRLTKEAPMRWQTPAELEEAAGLADPQLHDLYEKARYGNVPCTPEEARAAKRS